MRYVLLALLTALSFSSVTFAQDVVRFKNGKSVEVKILEMTEDVVSYKKWSYQEGPTINAPMSKVVSITYANGETEYFDEAAEAAAAQAPAPAPAPVPVAVPVAAPAPAPAPEPAPMPAPEPAPMPAPEPAPAPAPAPVAEPVPEPVPEPVVEPAPEPAPQEVAPVVAPAPVEQEEAAEEPAPVVKKKKKRPVVVAEEEPAEEEEEEAPKKKKKKKKRLGLFEDPDSQWYQARENAFSIWFDPMGFIFWGPMLGVEYRYKTLLFIDAHVRFSQVGYFYGKASNDPDDLSGLAFGAQFRFLIGTRTGGLYLGGFIDYGSTTALYDKALKNEEEWEWTTFVVAGQVGLRVRVSRHVFMDGGLVLGVLSVSEKDWRHSNPEHWEFSPTYNKTESGFDSAFGMLVLAWGYEF